MIPKKVKKKERIYKFIKEYKNIVLYEDVKTGVKESFTKFQLGLIKEKVKPQREGHKKFLYKH